MAEGQKAKSFSSFPFYLNLSTTCRQSHLATKAN